MNLVVLKLYPTIYKLLLLRISQRLGRLDLGMHAHFINRNGCSMKMKNFEHICLLQTFHGKRWEKFNSEKVASLAYARIQGKSALVAHFQNSSLMNEDKRCRPILFHSDGPNAGDQVCSLLVHLSLLPVVSWYMTVWELCCSVYKSGLSLKYASLNTLVILSLPYGITTVDILLRRFSTDCPRNVTVCKSPM